MWVSQATLHVQQEAIDARDRGLARQDASKSDDLRKLLAPLIEDARFQALPLHHPFREPARLLASLPGYEQPASTIMEWLALSGAVRALLAQEAASRWLSVHRPEALARMRQLVE